MPSVQKIKNAWLWTRNGARCGICGQYFEDDDTAILVFGSPKNVMAHHICYAANANGRTEGEMHAWITASKTPAAKNKPQEDVKQTLAVVAAIKAHWGYRVDDGPRVVRFYRGRRLVLSYDRRFNLMRLRIQERGLLDALILRNLCESINDHLSEHGLSVRWER